MQTGKPCIEDWEGFQHFQDLTESNHPVITLHPITTKHIKKSQIKPFPLKKKENDKKLSPTKVPYESSSPIQRPHRFDRHSLGIIPIEPKRAQISSIRRFSRVPIIRHEEQKHYSGRIIYKCFVPRSSDTLFRLLKEVNMTAPVEPHKLLHKIQFNSQFEGGNLGMAVQSGDCQYDLYMRVDTNTNGHRQWFYFSMRNQTKCRVKLHLFRFRKQYSLFQRGMRPYGLSKKDGKGWKPIGESVVYHREKMPNDCFVQKKTKNFILSFVYTFDNDDDEVYIAAGIPYTYTHLQNRLLSLTKQMQDKQLLFDVLVADRTMCGLDLQVVTITHKRTRPNTLNNIIVINARTHPGQTSSSWVMDGLLQEVTHSPLIAQWMAQHNITLKIIPMLNPDGVFIGNYRSGILGDDFNRKFFSGKKELYPEIYTLKNIISSGKKEGSIELFLDLHGHSVLKNSFIYGPGEQEFPHARYRSLPDKLQALTHYFRKSLCRFKQEDRIETARGYFQQKEKIFSYTCQNSLGLYEDKNTYQLFPQDWKAFGKSIALAFTQMYCKKIEIVKSIAPAIKTTIESNHHKPKNKTLIIQPIKEPHIEDAFKILLERTLEEKRCRQNRFKIRRKSQVMKTSLNNTANHKRKKQQLPSLSSQKQNSVQLSGFEQMRADTSDSAQISSSIKMMEDNMYDIEPIPQNFSQQYTSINDSDSSEQDLKQQEKGYIMEYLRVNRPRSEEKIHDTEIEKLAVTVVQAPINKFKQIRFKDIKEAREPRSNQKRKLDSIKMREVSRSQKQKVGDAGQFDDPSMVSISWQKKLYDRGRHLNRTQKEPFVLIQRKAKDDVLQEA